LAPNVETSCSCISVAARRSSRDLLEIASELEKNNVALEVLEQNINTTTPEGKLFFTMVAAFAEFEHSLMVVGAKD